MSDRPDAMQFEPVRDARRRPLNRDQLLELAHHKKRDPFNRSIDMRIARRRKKIEFDPAKPAVLKTVRGEGYMLVPGGE